MKKWLAIILVCTFVLAACGNQQSVGKDPVSEKPNNTEESLNPELIQEFSSLIEHTASPMEVKPDLDRMIQETNSKTADALVIDYLDYQEAFLQKGMEKYTEQFNKLYSYYNFETDSIDAAAIKEADLNEFYESFTSAGFKLVAIEGMLNPIIDYHYVAAYKNKLSAELTEYGSFMALNSDKPWASDAELAISLNDLADRIAIAEKFVSDYPNAAMKEKVISQYTLYLRSFLIGIDNTPLVRYKENVVDDQFIKAYHYFIEKYPDLRTTELVQSYVNELENKNVAPPYHNKEEKAAYVKKIDEKIKNVTEQF